MKRARGLQEQTSELQELRFQSCHVMPVLVFSSCLDCACSERSGCAIHNTLPEFQAASANEHPGQ